MHIVEWLFHGGRIDHGEEAILDTRYARRALLAHLDTFWQLNDKAMFRASDPMVAERLPELRVARMAPGGPSEPWVHVTVGAFEITAAGGKGWEFMLLGGDSRPAHVDTLGLVVRRHLLSPIDVGDVVSLGRPWADDSRCDHLLACPPYPYNVSLERCETADGPIRVVWMVPVTPEEVGLLRAEGAEALERCLQEAGVDFLSPGRPSTV